MIIIREGVSLLQGYTNTVETLVYATIVCNVPSNLYPASIPCAIPI